MLSEIAEYQQQRTIDNTKMDYNFNEMQRLIINDYMMHSFSFNFFNLFGNIRDLRINGHLLYRKELEQINKCCKSLKCLQITIHDPIACAELIECKKDNLEILSIHLGYTNITKILWNAISQCSKLKVLRIKDALLLESDINEIFSRHSPICSSIQIIELQTYNWQIQSEYQLKCKFPSLKALQRIDPMLYELKAIKCTENEIIHIHDFQAEWFQPKQLWRFKWL